MVFLSESTRCFPVTVVSCRSSHGGRSILVRWWCLGRGGVVRQYFVRLCCQAIARAHLLVPAFWWCTCLSVIRSCRYVCPVAFHAPRSFLGLPCPMASEKKLTCGAGAFHGELTGMHCYCSGSLWEPLPIWFLPVKDGSVVT